MTRWAAFAGLTGAVLFLVLLLARASQELVGGESSPDERAPTVRPEPEPASPERSTTHPSPEAGQRGERSGPEATPKDTPQHRREPTPKTREMSAGELLANVALSQGVLGLILVFAAWYAQVPAGALGVAGLSPSLLAVGAGLGVVLYLANEVGAGVAERVGMAHDERLREVLAPDSTAGWVVLLAVVLPVIAGFEELLFRAALVGAVPAGYGVSPWVMAVLSSVAFGVAHGAQGVTGIAVTGVLGLALAAAFVLTGSLVVVVVAHYLVNALEFLVHEALGIDWAGAG